MPTKPSSKKPQPPFRQLPKSPTGISGFDEITGGGLPTARPTLICGGPGNGKTLFALEFIVRGALQYGEPGVFMAFEEQSDELAANVTSLGFDLVKMQQDKLLRIDHVHIDRSEIEETGEYDLEGIFIRLGHAIDTIGAKRVVLDTIENLFGGLTDEGVLRAELRRLFTWLKDRGVTTIITGEKGAGTLTRQGLEEYVSDCVILLDHRVANQISTRLLRIVKYRGTVHGTNEYPFLIDEEGISVLPITSLMLAGGASTKRISTGVPSLDAMLGGKGFFRGSSILVSGTAGTGKTSIAGFFAAETCRRKEHCIYFAFEESPQQIMRNMTSIGINLSDHVAAGYLHFQASRPTLNGLEMHLLTMHKLVKSVKPKVVILDPITNLISVGNMGEVKSMLIRLIDFLQAEGITVMFTALTHNNVASDQADEGISSLVDAWVLVRDIETGGERNRGLYVMKSRGMNHSNQVREFMISDAGLNLVEVYQGPDGVLIGSAREAQQLQETTGEVLHAHAITRKDREIERKRAVLAAKIASLKEEFDSVQDELNKSYVEEELRKKVLTDNRAQLGSKRSR